MEERFRSMSEHSKDHDRGDLVLIKKKMFNSEWLVVALLSSASRLHASTRFLRFESMLAFSFSWLTVLEDDS